METKETYKFWLSRETQKYYEKDLQKLGLNGQELSLLISIGLPIEKNNFKFFPINPLKLILINNEQYIVLGSPFNKKYEDDIIMLHPIEKKIYFLSNSLFQINFVPCVVSIVNSNLESFLLFHMEFNKLHEEIFRETKQLPLDIVKIKLVKAWNCMDQADKIGLAWDADQRLFWREKLDTLITDIEELYDEFIEVDNLFPRLRNDNDILYGNNLS